MKTPDATREPLTAAEQAPLIFEALEALVSGTNLPFMRAARPVVFELLTGGGIWSFAPGRGRDAFVNADHPEAVLRIYTTVEVLTRLVFMSDVSLTADDPWFFAGDPTALEPIVACLSGQQSPLETRIAARGGR